MAIKKGNNNLSINTDIDYMNEAFSLLVRLGIGANYEKTYQDLYQKHPACMATTKAKFEILEKIEQQTLNLLSSNKEYQDTLDYYFDANPENSECIATLVLLYADFVTFQPKNINELSTYLTQLDSTSFNKDFSKLLQGYNDIVKDDSNYVELTSSIEIIRHIMNLELKSEEKWKILEIYTNPAPHREKILNLMDAVISILHEFSPDLQTLVNDFANYWGNKLIELTPAEYILQSFGIVFEENPNGTILSPEIMHMNQVHFTSDEKKTNAPDKMKIGILFDDVFTIQPFDQTNPDSYCEDALKNFKLLSDRSKFDILCYIKDKRAYGSELAKQLNLTTATISHHMSSLLATGLVKMEKVDNKVYYTLNKENIERLLKYAEEKLL